MDEVTLYTDGSVFPNPGDGGYAAILLCKGRERVVSGGDRETTNNRMELMALLAGLRVLKRPCAVTVVTDSQLVIGWLSQGWQRNDVECTFLCQEIESVAQTHGHTLAFRHVKGHSDDLYNDRCDAIAKREREAMAVQEAHNG